jgi:hypothetical protein
MTSKEARKSWHEDRAVQDNIVESWLCVDCGWNTHPGCASGPEFRFAIAMGADGDTVTFDRDTEVYDVRNAIWRQADMRPWSGCLCVGCLEKRIGRRLRPKDFSLHDRRLWANFPCTDRLLNRRGFATVTVRTKDGPRKVICDIADAPIINGAVIMEEEVT